MFLWERSRKEPRTRSANKEREDEREEGERRRVWTHALNLGSISGQTLLLLRLGDGVDESKSLGPLDSELPLDDSSGGDLDSSVGEDLLESLVVEGERKVGDLNETHESERKGKEGRSARLILSGTDIRIAPEPLLMRKRGIEAFEKRNPREREERATHEEEGLGGLSGRSLPGGSRSSGSSNDRLSSLIVDSSGLGLSRSSRSLDGRGLSLSERLSSLSSLNDVLLGSSSTRRSLKTQRQNTKPNQVS